MGSGYGANQQPAQSPRVANSPRSPGGAQAPQVNQQQRPGGQGQQAMQRAVNAVGAVNAMARPSNRDQPAMQQQQRPGVSGQPAVQQKRPDGQGQQAMQRAVNKVGAVNALAQPRQQAPQVPRQPPQQMGQSPAGQQMRTQQQQQQPAPLVGSGKVGTGAVAKAAAGFTEENAIGRARDDSVLSEEVRPIVAMINQLLRNRQMLKFKIKHCFDQVATNEQINRDGLKQLQERLSQRMSMPIEAFGTTDAVDFERFDFKGSGTLSVNQAYKMVKFSLVEYRKLIGGADDKVDIEWKDSLASAGYQIEKVLGHGAYGEAKQARDRDGKHWCIKCFPKEKMSSTALQDLSQEFQTLNLLSCNSVAGASQLFQDNSSYYMVGELFRGGEFDTLKSKARAQGVSITQDWYRGIFLQIVEGLVFMHQQAIIHCDIKEPNLMVKTAEYSRPQVVIIDLGVTVSVAKPDPKIPHGTPGYVPPETLETLKWFPVGDLFSLGVTILQMLIDKTPSDNGGGIFIEGCHGVQEVFVATRKRSHPMHLVPPELAKVGAFADKLLTKKRQQRPLAVQCLKDPLFARLGKTQRKKIQAPWLCVTLSETWRRRTLLQRVASRRQC